ncbi:MAG: LuxR C-terminal-related transcriptional regulator [Chloroflexota bacterium]
MRSLEMGCQPDCHLILVSAPAGFGKTTLVANWIRRSLGQSNSRLQNRVAWVTLDGRDNNPDRFMLYLLAGLQRIIPHLGRDFPDQSQVSSIPALEAIFTALLNQLSEISGQALIVLDDYHLITNPLIHQILSFFIENLPPQATLVIISRADPPFPLARLRARGQIVELRAADLRFTHGESAVFLRQVMKIDLSEEQLAALASHTEGWIAGLQMAALTMRRQNDLDGFIAAFSGSHRYILDYLMEEVFGQQSEQRQEFLLRTAILERMNGSLCEAVSSQTGGQATLEALEGENLFVVPLDDVRGWYRYHHLFADLLNSLLRQQYSPAAIHMLHRAASQWFQAAGFLEDALEHALAAQDYERAAEMIETYLVALFSRSEVSVLLGWIEKLPSEIVRARPWIDVYRANTLALTGRSAEADALLDDVERRITPESPEQAELLGHIAAVRAYTANLRGNAARCIEMAALTSQYLPEKFLTAHGMAALARSDACLAQDDIKAAHQALQEMRKVGEQTGQIMLGVPALCDLATIQKIQGHLHQAEALYQSAFRWLEDQDELDSRARCSYEFGMADLLREWNQLEEAYQHALIGDEIRKRLGGYLVIGDLVLMRILQARGDSQAALEAGFTAEKLMQPNQFHLTTNLEFQTARIVQWLAVGDVDAASRWVQNCKGSSELEQIARARLHLAKDECAAALHILDAQRRLAEDSERYGRLIEILCLQALALERLDRQAESALALTRAIYLGRPAGYTRVFLDCGQSMCALLERLQKQNMLEVPQDRRHVQTILDAFQIEGGTDVLVETRPGSLTEREVDVLRALAEGASNKEIAARLIVAPSTIKQHLKNIYGKLGVHNRTQAVDRGRELGLL